MSQINQIGNNIDGEAVADLSGESVSLNSDGSIVAVGASNNDGNGTTSGHVRVFQNIGGSWVQIGSDIEGETAGDRLGSSVSLSDDGNIVAIGGVGNNVNGVASGHVRVFQNSGGSWVQIGDDIYGVAMQDLFGHSVSLSGDGSIVAIGGVHNDANGSNSGHVRVFQNSGGSWVQIGDDINGVAVDDLFGWSVSLSNDGNIMAIGARANDGNGSNSGHVRVFQNSGGSWVQIGGDINGETAGDFFGESVSLNSDGSIVAIGAPKNDGNGNEAGHVRVFQITGGSWVQIGGDIDGEGIGDHFGWSVSLSDDGNIVASGAIYNYSANGNLTGHARVYKNLGGNWTQIGDDINGEAESDQFGYSVELSVEGNIVAIGGPLNDGNGNDSGHVRVFDLSNVLLLNEHQHLEFSIHPVPTSGNLFIKSEAVISQIELFNYLGQLIISNNKSTKIDLSSIKSGLYLLKIKDEYGNYGIKKVLKE